MNNSKNSNESQDEIINLEDATIEASSEGEDQSVKQLEHEKERKKLVRRIF